MPRHFIDKQTITNGVMTGTATITGAIVNVQNIDHPVYQCTVTSGASPVGNLQLFGSNDGTNFAQIGSNVAVTANGTKLVPDATPTVLAIHAYKYSRLDYVNTSGTGVLNVFFHGKSSG